MAGFFDMFGSDPKSQGMLAAAAQIMQSSGPSFKPTGLGQILGGGLEAYQQTEQRAREQGQIGQMRGLQIKNAESDLAAQELARQRAQELQNLTKSYQITRGAQQQPQQAAQAPQDRSGAAMFQGLLNGQAPVVSAPGEQMQQPMGAAPTAPSGTNRNALVQERLQYAQYLRDNGYQNEASAAEESALKLQPKVSRWEEVQQGGRVMFAPFFEDGTNGAPVPLDVAKKLDAINRGGSTDLVHPVTGATVRSMKNSISPEAAASNALGYANLNLSKERLNFDKQYRTATEARADKEFALRQQIGKAPTEFQGKSAAFGLRATESDKILRSLTYDPAAINSKVSVSSWPLVGGILGAATNTFGLTESDQRAEQSQRDFINAVLRQESGAAIADTEFDNARKQYFPQPGDGKAVIAQKARARQLSIQGLQMNAGRAAMTAPPAASGGATFLGFE
jgi:hypothetical protein